MSIKNLLNSFFHSNKISGLLLIFSTIVSLIIANSVFGNTYIDFWHTSLFGRDMHFWINDVLMSVFFLLIGLELERELYVGELSNIKDALLPLFAAIGGMLVPALFYLLLNHNSDFTSGFGIVMATDIAFAIGVLSLLGKRVPTSLKVFLIALAIFDDLGAILIIALMYSNDLIISNVLIALGIFLILLLLNYKKVQNLIPYIIGGIIMWYFIYKSGIHPTITGVLLAFTIPFSRKKTLSCSTMLEDFLHIPVFYFIIPIFAIANTAIKIEGDFTQIISQPYSIGIILGLLFGKPIGIFLFSWFGIKAKFFKLPKNINLKHILSIGFLGGIGFTMSIFITLLAFNQPEIQNNAKIAILIASFTAAIVSLVLLSLSLKKTQSEELLK
ncbi:MAG: Na+/H+ antiporter NhaA [Bacteroidales bacterium]|nr:Na+/H+ antiporter NhaA [Bacteroidales bacterium]